jgi:hypothetical protein
MPTIGVGGFVIFCLLPEFASHFSSLPLLFVRRRRCFAAILCSNAHFLPEMKTPPPLLPWFSCDSFHFHHPVADAGDLSRPIRSKMVWNNSRGTATSAIWKTVFREWRTTFAPILISFSRNEASVSPHY